jgi:TPR repeat protein
MERKLALRSGMAFAILWIFSLSSAQTVEDPQTQYNQDTAYWYGNGVPQNYGEAAKWYRKAAEQGYAEAQYRLGQMLEIGQGVKEDDAEAAKWYRKAAEQGVVLAEHNLGTMYVFGRKCCIRPCDRLAA